MQHVGPVTGKNRRTLFRRCKKAASERDYICYPYTRGSENLPNKMQKNAFRRAWVLDSPVTGPQNVHFTKLGVFLFAYDPAHARRKKERVPEEAGAHVWYTMFTF